MDRQRLTQLGTFVLLASVLMTAGCPHERTWDADGKPRFLEEPINPPDEITIFVYPTHFKELEAPDRTTDLMPEIRTIEAFFDGEQRYQAFDIDEFYHEQYGWMESATFRVDDPCEEIFVKLEVLHIGRRYEMTVTFLQDEDGNWVGDFTEEAVRIQ